jgi:hypothetical protein
VHFCCVLQHGSMCWVASTVDTYKWLTACSRALLESKYLLREWRNYPFYGTKRFITKFTGARELNPVLPLTYYFFKINYYIISMHAHPPHSVWFDPALKYTWIQIWWWMGDILLCQQVQDYKLQYFKDFPLNLYCHITVRVWQSSTILNLAVLD